MASFETAALSAIGLAQLMVFQMNEMCPWAKINELSTTVAFAVVPQECTGFCISTATHQMQDFYSIGRRLLCLYRLIMMTGLRFPAAQVSR